MTQPVDTAELRRIAYGAESSDGEKLILAAATEIDSMRERVAVLEVSGRKCAVQSHSYEPTSRREHHPPRHQCEVATGAARHPATHANHQQRLGAEQRDLEHRPRRP